MFDGPRASAGATAVICVDEMMTKLVAGVAPKETAVARGEICAENGHRCTARNRPGIGRHTPTAGSAM